MLMVRTEFWADGNPWCCEFFYHPDPEVIQEFAKKAVGLAESGYWGVCGEESVVQSIALDGARPGELDNLQWLWSSL